MRMASLYLSKVFDSQRHSAVQHGESSRNECEWRLHRQFNHPAPRTLREDKPQSVQQARTARNRELPDVRPLWHLPVAISGHPSCQTGWIASCNNRKSLVCPG